jgi:hypothetical protein
MLSTPVLPSGFRSIWEISNWKPGSGGESLANALNCLIDSPRYLYNAGQGRLVQDNLEQDSKYDTK